MGKKHVFYYLSVKSYNCILIFISKKVKTVSYYPSVKGYMTESTDTVTVKDIPADTYFHNTGYPGVQIMHIEKTALRLVTPRYSDFYV
jgi:hypothetical protein